MCKIEDKVFFEQLHEDYYDCTDEKERIVLRNAILQQTYPLIEGTVRKLSRSKYNADLFQHIVLKAIDSPKCKGIIAGWKPTNKSTEGYYRKCFFNCGLNFVLQAEMLAEREESQSPTEHPIWEYEYFTDSPEIIEDEFYGLDGSKRDAYDRAMLFLSKGGTTGGMKNLVKYLQEEFELDKHEAKDAYYHALISSREMYKHKVDNCSNAVDTSSFFGRMTKYLEDEQIEDIMKVFGGIFIKIPKWKSTI